MEIDQGLPGADLVAQGLADLHAGAVTPVALLVCIGAPRLRRLGIAIPEMQPPTESVEMSLYRLLWNEDPRRAHSSYNALIRRLVSFARAVETRRWARLHARPIQE